MEPKLTALLAGIIGALVGFGRYSSEVLYLERKFRWLEMLLSGVVGGSLGLVVGLFIIASFGSEAQLWAFALAGAVAAGGDKGFELLYKKGSGKIDT